MIWLNTTARGRADIHRGSAPKMWQVWVSEVAQSCPTLCDPMDCSPPGSSVRGIFQARVLEWLPFLSPGDLPDPGIEPRSPALQADAFPPEPPGQQGQSTARGLNQKGKELHCTECSEQQELCIQWDKWSRLVAEIRVGGFVEEEELN